AGLAGGIVGGNGIGFSAGDVHVVGNAAGSGGGDGDGDLSIGGVGEGAEVAGYRAAGLRAGALRCGGGDQGNVGGKRVGKGDGGSVLRAFVLDACQVGEGSAHADRFG